MNGIQNSLFRPRMNLTKIRGKYEFDRMGTIKGIYFIVWLKVKTEYPSQVDYLSRVLQGNDCSTVYRVHQKFEQSISQIFVKYGCLFLLTKCSVKQPLLYYIPCL